ncbi:50S ribosomal protein L1 isoform X2 [Ricinus communis]|uniref:50S ribosomal protein L1 isoform X2 n=1 Tax=Ricinus communis TaxID=3988 RepID=UPI00201AA114|nr:50S ribosomal protein L1 isoform X2 [Ricinus communis]
MKKLILSQVGRYCPHEPKAKPFSSLFHSRYLSTSDSNPFVPIQPVSYPVKPKEENKNANENENQELTREDIRYVKDAVSSHPSTRVAPLPEYKKEAQDQEIEGETRKIEAIRFRRVVEEEETVSVPFPRLIKPVKKETRPLFDLADAIKQLKANARTTFDETVEAHVRLGIPKSRSDLIVRGTLSLPHGGKKVLRIAVFAEGADADEARAAGADVVGGTDLIDQIARDGKIDFDKCFTTTQIFPRVVKLARILNRHGLMPDAKVSFSEESLRENVGAFMNAILQAKPAGLKKTSKYAGYVNTVHICSTMGPGFPVSIQSLSKAVDHYNKVHLKSPA